VAEPLDYEADLDVVPPKAVPVIRTLVAGFLMGTANLVPGVSGGTMVLACGLYAHFVDATADLTRLKFSKFAALFIALLFGAKFAAMGLLGTLVATLVARHQAPAYALFLGMTLAGTPVLWRAMKGAATWTWALVPVGIVLMAALAWVPKAEKTEPGDDYVPRVDVPMDVVAGGAAYSAMVLPGVSGGTVKLALGRYEPTVWSIGQAGQAVIGRSNPPGQWLPILLPYVAGAAVGLVAVSNGLKWVLKKYEHPTLAVLLGVLWGSVLPIWPFQNTPATAGNVAVAIVAAAIGFALVYALTRWKSSHTPAEA
jgi:putative membrane protein